MLRRVLQLAALRFRSDEFKEREIVALRHELAALRRQVARPKLRAVEAAGETCCRDRATQSERLLPIAERHQSVARLLCDPISVRVAGAGHVLDPPPLQRDEEEHIDASEPDGLDDEPLPARGGRQALSARGPLLRSLASQAESAQRLPTAALMLLSTPRLQIPRHQKPALRSDWSPVF